MEFIIMNFANNKLYFITLDGVGELNFFAEDEDIADLIDLSIEEYSKLIISFGAFKEPNAGFVFINENKAQKFADYLNNKYLVMLKLSGKI